MKATALLLFVLATPSFAETAPASQPAANAVAIPRAPQLGSVLEFLRVHPQSDRLIAEGATEVPGYRLAEQVLHNDKEGKPDIVRLWIQTTQAAAAEGCYICEKDVAEASPDEARPGYLDFRFSMEGARKMQRLTSSCRIGLDRLAIVVNGRVSAAPVVQDVIEAETCISGLSRVELETIVDACRAALEAEQWEAEDGED